MTHGHGTVHELGNGLFAYVQDPGTWGWSNAGMVVDGGEGLLVDTLFDLKLTQGMLKDLRDAHHSPLTIGVLVNTHGDGDHTFGNELFSGSRIVSSAQTAARMAEARSPQDLSQQLAAADPGSPMGRFVRDHFGSFDFSDVRLTHPTETFSASCTLQVGDRAVELTEVGPAHTRGDVIVRVPGSRVVFTGDVVFSHDHPVVWSGPVENWIAVCDDLLESDAELFVPGHGRLCEKGAVREQRDYLAYLRDEAERCFSAGMSEMDAARTISLDRWADWPSAERLVVNVGNVYARLRDPENPAPIERPFELMAQFSYGAGAMQA